MNWERLKTHYLRAGYTTQLDWLALNLIRIQLLAHSGTDELVVKHLIRESQFFIEWLVPHINLDADLVSATELVNLQRSLSAWKLGWNDVWCNEATRQDMAAIAQQWGDRLQRQRILPAS